MKYEEIGLPEKRGNTFEGADGCDPLLEAYITEMITPEDDYLHRLYRATQTKLLRPRMASGHWQGMLLRLLTKLLRPKRVLEIGTYTGYSALRSMMSKKTSRGRGWKVRLIRRASN